MKKKKISNYTYPKGSIKTYWGEITAKRDSFLIIIGGVGTFEVFGQLTAETDGDKVWLSGKRFEEEKKVIEGELEA
jgi:hypothetical protein